MNTSSEFPAAADPLPPNAIAVIGMAGRFPGAASVSAFWNNLRRGEESIVTLSEEELSDAGIGEKTLANPAYVRRAPLLDGIDEFDADFFGFPPQAARMTDPQHRLFLECAWHALEDAGCEPARFDGSIGVYGTSSASGYLVHNLLSHHDPNAIMGQGANFELIGLSLQNDKDFLTTRVSHQFDLRGPSVAVQTACSSSLVAVHLACQSLLSGECDMALAGGVSIRIPQQVGYWHEPGSMVSAVGHCRPFDVRSDGTVFGSGVAIVVLKPLQAAVDDGDRIHAVIRGSALNNDGSMKMGYAAPSAAAQADVIAEAHAVAGVDSSTVSFVETHGTATPLGDPIEIEGLRKAFGVSDATRPGPCMLGSVKSNIGHMEVASGIAGLIKAILCLKHRAIPATLHFTSPNPELRLDRGPFTVQSDYGPWEWEGVRRAGVSSFGVGGTNAHVVLEEAPGLPARDERPGPKVLLLSARTAEALRDSRSALATELAGPDPLDMSDVAFTLGRRRKDNIRLCAVVNDQQHAALVLQAPEHDNAFIGDAVAGTESTTESNTDRVVFAFPGQGAQHVGMARGLYESEPVFAQHFDRCAEGFGAELGIDLRAAVFDGPATDLARTDRAQPALFAVEYALAKLADAYGVRAGAYAGHSIGEFVAATLAGVFDLETAVKAVSVRSRLMNAAPPGVMAAVALSPDAIAEYLSPGVDLATVNEPGSCVVAGSEQTMRELQDRLAGAGIVARRVRTSHAFHSSSMDAVVGEFEDYLCNLEFHKPDTPLLSNVTGTWMTADEATDPAMWARQVRATVRFADEVDAMLADPCRVVVEVGPGGTLTGSAIRHPRWSSGHRAVRLMRHQAQNRSDRDTFLLALGQLWTAGIDVDWTPLAPGHQPRLVSLPGYPFVRQRHWVDRKQTVDWVDGSAGNNGIPVASSNGSAHHQNSAVDGRSRAEATLHDIWVRCLGVDTVDRKANFLELGGDSLIAISVATAAAKEGLDLSPQDLYEYPSVAALAAALDARDAASGLAVGSSNGMVNPPVPPNIAYFLEHGVSDAGRWCFPLILRIDSRVGVEDVRSVLTAVTNHHDALRLRLVERAGTWEQQIGQAQEFSQLVSHSLADDAGPRSPQERDAVLDALAEHHRGQDLSGSPLTATYVLDSQGEPRCLAINVHEMVADNTSREILLTDIFTAFAQRLAGEEVALEPATTNWSDWSQRCAALATHPAVLESRDYWLENSTGATLRLAEQDPAEAPGSDDMTRMSSVLTNEQTSQVDDARRRLQLAIDQILLAALGRTIAATIGDGVVTVDLEGLSRPILKPDVDLRRTVGRFTTIFPFQLACVKGQNASAMEILDDIRHKLDAVPHHGIGYGLLRYVYAPTASLFGAQRPPDIHFRYAGAIPELPSGDAPVQFDTDTALSVRETVAGLGHAIELRAYRSSGVLHLDWWYDARRLQRETVEGLVQNFPVTLTELINEAIAATQEDGEMDSATASLGLVDLSAGDFG